MSFISDITTNIRTEGIIKSIIEMGHYLNLSVIAEGVEEEQQINILNNHNCDLVQGYYFSKPLSTKNLEEFWNIMH